MQGAGCRVQGAGYLVTALPTLSSKRHVYSAPVRNPKPLMAMGAPPLAVRVRGSAGEMAETAPRSVSTADDSEDSEVVPEVVP